MGRHTKKTHAHKKARKKRSALTGQVFQKFVFVHELFSLCQQQFVQSRKRLETRASPTFHLVFFLLIYNDSIEKKKRESVHIRASETTGRIGAGRIEINGSKGASLAAITTKRKQRTK